MSFWNGPPEANPLSLDPLGPIGISPVERFHASAEPLALAPLSPVPAGGRRIQAGDAEQAAKGAG